MRRGGRRGRIPMRWAGRRGRLLLVAVTTALATVEAVALAGTGEATAMPLASQVSAPPAFSIFHDLRWIAVFHNSWPMLAGELLAVVVFRGVLHATLIRLAWPDTSPRPAFRSLLASSLTFTAAAAAALSVWVAIGFAAAVTSLSWLALAEILAFALFATAMARGGITEHWWARLPSWQTMGWSLVTFLALCAAGLATSISPGWVDVPVASAFGALNALLWLRLVRSVVTHAPLRVPVPTTPVILALFAFGLVPVGGAFLGFVEPSPDAATAPAAYQRVSQRTGRPIVVVDGYDSSVHGEPTTDDSVVRFSYAGLSRSGRPLPYDKKDTHAALPVAAAKLARQIDVLHRRTGKPVDVIAISEGTVVVRTYLAHERNPPVHTVLLASPLVAPARVSYPPRNAPSGWGIGTAWELRGIFRIVAAEHGAYIGPDEPFLRSLVHDAPLYQDHAMSRVPGVRVVAVMPSLDALAAPPGKQPGDLPRETLTGLHGQLLKHRGTRARMTAILAGAQVGPGVPAQFLLIRGVGCTWQVPTLPR